MHRLLKGTKFSQPTDVFWSGEKTCEMLVKFPTNENVKTLKELISKLNSSDNPSENKDVEISNGSLEKPESSHVEGNNNSEEKLGNSSTKKTFETKGLCGLKNLGNTCFMNSILQCMFNTKELADYFPNEKFKNNINLESNQGGIIAECFAGLWKEVRSSQSNKSISPETFRLVFEPIRPDLINRKQQCASEFFDALYNALDEDLNKHFYNPDSTINSELQFVFKIKFKIKLECPHCGYKREVSAELSRLDLGLPELSMKLSVEELIDYYFQPAEVTCDSKSCKKNFKMIKTVKISRLPPVIVLTIKRAQAKQNAFKDKRRITFPLLNLDFGNHFTGTNDAGGYNLYAVVHHDGDNFTSGHYTASCKSVDDSKWYCFDDAKDVKEDGGYYVADDRVYMLFYSKAAQS